MVYKGLIVEVKNDHIIVITEDNCYIKLKNKGNVDIGKKIIFLEEDIIKENNKSFKSLIGIAVAIIIAIITMVGRFGVERFEAYAIVSLDINPSVEFQIDEENIVRKVNSLNIDGKELIEDNMIGMKIEDAIIAGMKTAIEKQYLNNKNNVVLVSNVIIDDTYDSLDAIEDTIYDRIEEEKEFQDIDVICINSDKEDLKKARENNISVGKYKVYEILSNDNPDIKIEDIKDKKVSQIVKENKEFANNDTMRSKKKEKDKKNIKIEKEFEKEPKEKTNSNKEHKKKEQENKENENKGYSHNKAIKKSTTNNEKNIDDNDDYEIEKKNEDKKDNAKDNAKGNKKDNAKDNKKDDEKDSKKDDEKDDKNEKEIVKDRNENKKHKENKGHNKK
ncbi:anti-sigma factor domain-containing protein [Abyssisolibacter fermentans]|uniref:anti-sigma factor domain-containing protein n=1 Tax=Abyssisolibacter fermentans TaxID=1766203 RepID=UPI00082B7DFC|nr:anti-sigma factor domain-containing protein [Abyssisolibacter fermentans]